jgi:hypothetical protein
LQDDVRHCGAAVLRSILRVMPAARANDLDYVRVINAVRLELEAAGNPSYVVVVIGATGEVELTPMVFSTVGPASDHAGRLGHTISGTGERVVIVSRSAADQRAMFAVIDPRALRRLYQRFEVIEETFAEINAKI